jgi:Protein of unknown function (DUF3293)
MRLAPDDPWSAYARTVVVIAPPGLDPVVVRAAPPGETGDWPWPSGATIHILTAWNPGPARPGVEENRRRQRRLESDLADLAELGVPRWPARGVDPESGERDEGVAVAGLAEGAVLDVARRYGQDAVFAWSPAAWAVVACAGGRRVTSGWRTGREGLPLDVLRKT